LKSFFKIFLCISSLLLLCPLANYAWHIVGADFYYENIGPNQYEITITVYRDCNQTQGAPFDAPVIVDIFRGQTVIGQTSLSLPQNQPVLPVTLNTKCPVRIPNVCVEKATYVDVITLPSVPGDYTLVYQRCCRNETVVNLIDPETQGASFVAIIPHNPPAVVNNSNPVFTDFPPVALCKDIEFTFDHLATDKDGDSIVYKFCQPFLGGSQSDPYPSGPGGFGAAPPPFQGINYSPGYTFDKPLGGDLTLDPITGLLIGTPTTLGQFVVGICAEEWRNGVKIGETKRDFQFNVVECESTVNASTVPEYNDCISATIGFSSTSTGAVTHFWDFGIPGVNNDTSNLANPTFSYPDTGTYTAMLIINKGFTCPDTAYSIVRIYPGFTIDAGFEVDCYGIPIQFTDISFNKYGKIVNYFWDFGDGNVSNDKDPVHTYEEGGLYDISHTIRSDKGCVGTFTSQIVVFERPFLNAGEDVYIYNGETALLNATGATNYLWLNDDPQITVKTMPNPLVAPTETTTYFVETESNYGCKAVDSVTVHVLERPLLKMPTAFTPNQDGLNDYLFPFTERVKRIVTFQVYNRWGQLIFESNDFENRWNGTYNNINQEIGNYAWYISAIDIYDIPLEAKGNVTLLR